MSRTIKLGFDSASVSKALAELQGYQLWLREKATALAFELTAMGLDLAAMSFESAEYDGPRGDVVYDAEDRGNGVFAIIVDGETAVILEFGSGVKYGGGHPLADKVTPNMGPGTHPNKHYSRNSRGELVANWENDRGWYLPKEAGGGHTFGNPPSMTMFNTADYMRKMLSQVAKDVFSK